MGVSTLDDTGPRKWWIQQSWIWEYKGMKWKLGLLGKNWIQKKLEEVNSEKLYIERCMDIIPKMLK